jgi:cytochrome c oxidase subunit 2
LPSSPTSIFSPAATPAHSIFTLSIFVLVITACIFLTVAGLLTYVLIRYRERDAEADYEPAQIYGSNQIELSWTVIPILIIVVLFLSTARIVLGTEKAARPKSAVDVVAIGHQFWWEFYYPKLGVTTANELHVPVSTATDPMPTYLQLSSADVDHSFWVPRLAGKTDLIPNRINTMWIDPQATGLYLGQCAQYCGIEHAKMLLRVYVDTPEQFAQWAAAQSKPAVVDAHVAEGRAIFENNACANCHTIKGTRGNGKFGPDLTHLASRDTLASGIVPNTAQNLKIWIDNPDMMKPGSLMPPMHLSDHDMDALVAYLQTLH